MRKSDDYKEILDVDALVAVRKKSDTLYNALKSACMKRGYMEICRFTKKMTMKESGDNRKVILDPSLDETMNNKLAKLIFRMANSTKTALDMYNLFFVCDNMEINASNATEE